MPTPNGSTTWQVDHQVQRTVVTTNGQVQDGYEVAFTTGQGHSGTVFLPTAQYRPENVRAAINAQAELLDGVGSLTSEG